MAQKDYVGHAKSGARRKNIRRSKSQGSGISKTVIVLAVAAIAVFACGVYFITHKKAPDTSLLPANNHRQGNGLPPKPEERWSYIKELENRQVGIASPTEPSAGGEVRSDTQLTPEQRQLLEQMQADMRQQPTQLSEVPYNAQALAKTNTLTPRTETPTTPSFEPVQPSVTPPHYTINNPVTAPSASNQAADNAAAVAAAKANQLKLDQEKRDREKAKEKEREKAQQEKNQRWTLQCGSFKTTDQAEEVRAQLAFNGIESRISASGGWSRVMVGSYKDRVSADAMLKRLKSEGMSNCIPLAIGG